MHEFGRHTFIFQISICSLSDADVGDVWRMPTLVGLPKFATSRRANISPEYKYFNSSTWSEWHEFSISVFALTQYVISRHGKSFYHVCCELTITLHSVFSKMGKKHPMMLWPSCNENTKITRVHTVAPHRNSHKRKLYLFPDCMCQQCDKAEEMSLERLTFKAVFRHLPRVRVVHINLEVINHAGLQDCPWLCPPQGGCFWLNLSRTDCTRICTLITALSLAFSYLFFFWQCIICFPRGEMNWICWNSVSIL